MPWAVAGAIGGALIASEAAGDAADTQANATRDASNATLQAQREALAAQKPFMDAGLTGVHRLQELLGLGSNTGAAGFGSLNKPFSFTQGDLSNDPKFKFQQREGQNALDRKAAAGGGFYSGQGLRAGAAFNQELAGTTFDDAYGRAFNEFQTNRSNTLNPLQALAGQGQSAANNTGQIQMNGGNTLASLITNNANAQGASQIAQGNALTGGINSGLSNWQRAQYLNTLNKPPAAPAPAKSWDWYDG